MMDNGDGVYDSALNRVLLTENGKKVKPDFMVKAKNIKVSHHARYGTSIPRSSGRKGFHSTWGACHGLDRKAVL